MSNRKLDLSQLSDVDQRAPEPDLRILRLVENESAHRIDQENTALHADIGGGRRGQILAALISCIALVGAIITALAGVHPSVPIALVGIPILASAKGIIWPKLKSDARCRIHWPERKDDGQ